MKSIILIVILALVGGGYYFFYPPMVLKHRTEQALEEFSKAVEAKDRAKISEVLGKYLAEEAKPHLEVTLFSLSQPEGKPTIQDFDKPTFITFIDNTLYSLDDYHYEVALQKFNLAADKKSASVTFASKEWADGKEYYMGTAMNMRYHSNTLCEGEVDFDGGKTELAAVNCKMTLGIVPKPDEILKSQNPEALGRLLR